MAGIAVALLLTGCGAQTSPGAATGPSGGSAAGSSFPSTTVRTVSGTNLTVPNNKPALFYFFTASCSSCVTGAKSVGAGVAKAGSGVQAVAVDLDPGEPVNIINGFMQDVGNPPLSVVRDDGTLLKRFNVDALGLTMVLDKAGRVVYRGVDPSAAQTAQAIAAAGS
ncbi:redoxin family protein [Leifsonia aquatica ATCC 14665]|uniref:Redoxin family protein n=1 Tax=Leifsonia aquatica ATCC 14665 TaxID=1358026 RepID=U2RX33_LEIAQ|nr:redoxin family protein [Leifsonia aquatica ATCC 14665]